jgi:iron(III) transport system ATP-binding protein
VRYGIAVGGSEVLVDSPFQSGAEMHEIGATVGVTVPEQRMLFLPA